MQTPDTITLTTQLSVNNLLLLHEALQVIQPCVGPDLPTSRLCQGTIGSLVSSDKTAHVFDHMRAEGFPHDAINALRMCPPS